MENAKMIKTSVVIDRILKILQGVIIAGIIVCLIFAVLLLFLGEKMIANADIVTFGTVRLILKDGVSLLDGSAFRSSIALSLVFSAVSLAAVFYGIRLIREVLEPMKEGRPFDKGVSETIKRLAWVALIGGAIIQISGKIIEIAEMKAYDFASLGNANVIAGFEFDYLIDLNFIVTAGVLFLLSYVFRYGEELQRESDETL